MEYKIISSYMSYQLNANITYTYVEYLQITELNLSSNNPYEEIQPHIM